MLSSAPAVFCVGDSVLRKTFTQGMCGVCMKCIYSLCDQATSQGWCVCVCVCYVRTYMRIVLVGTISPKWVPTATSLHVFWIRRHGRCDVCLIKLFE